MANVTKKFEFNNKKLESTRFELSTKNAELQEKIVKLQADIVAYKKTAKEGADTEQRMAELAQLLEDANKQENQLKSRIKTLERQNAGLKKVRQYIFFPFISIDLPNCLSSKILAILSIFPSFCFVCTSQDLLLKRRELLR